MTGRCYLCTHDISSSHQHPPTDRPTGNYDGLAEPRRGRPSEFTSVVVFSDTLFILKASFLQQPLIEASACSGADGRREGVAALLLFSQPSSLRYFARQ